MAKTIKELGQALRKSVNEIEAGTQDELNRLGLDLSAEIKSRVINTQTDSKGNKFSDYSRDYKKRREKRGYSNKAKNFFFSGEMWRGFSVDETGKYFVELGGKTNYSRDVIGYNTEREDNIIIEPSKKEMDNFASKYVAWITAILKKNL